MKNKKKLVKLILNSFNKRLLLLVGGITVLSIVIYTLSIQMKNEPSNQLSWTVQKIYSAGVKIKDPIQLPQGCTTSKNICWQNALADGRVKLIETSAKDSSGRKIVFAYFINTSTAFGVTGLYNYLPIFRDNGALAASDISGGDASEIDWVYGTPAGIIVHEKSSDTCYERYLSETGSAWSNRLVTCPQ